MTALALVSVFALEAFGGMIVKCAGDDEWFAQGRSGAQAVGVSLCEDWMVGVFGGNGSELGSDRCASRQFPYAQKQQGAKGAEERTRDYLGCCDLQ